MTSEREHGRAEVSPVADPLFERVRIVLCRPQIDGNVGAVARAMLNFGPRRLILVTPRADHLSREATRRARAGEIILREAEVVDDIRDAVAGCSRVIGSTARQRATDRAPLRPAQAVSDALDDLDDTGDLALVFGHETAGMSNTEVDQCHLVMTIPTSDELPSLNLGVATAIALYELRQAVTDRADAGQWPPRRREEATTDRLATADELEGMYGQMENALRAVNFLNPQNPDITMRYFRRFFAHAQTSEFEVRLWRAALRRFINSVGHARLRPGARKLWAQFVQKENAKRAREGRPPIEAEIEPAAPTDDPDDGGRPFEA